MSERYKAVEGSELTCCCFEATVVDTQASSPSFRDKPDLVCECFDMESAQKIANALNAASQPAPDVAKLVALLIESRENLEDVAETGMPTSTAPTSTATMVSRNLVSRIDAALAAHRKQQEKNHDN